MPAERLQKILARAGVASRRRAETLITAGRVAVDGRVVAELGAKADPRKQRITVDGKPIAAERRVYLLLHKPRGVVSTVRDPEGRQTVLDLVRGIEERVVPVGRLDFHTSGVLLLSNDGDFANGLLHPKHRVPRVYVVKVQGAMSEEDLDRWRNGVRLGRRLTAPAEVRFMRHEGNKTWFEITLRQGQNRQIVRMGEETGFPVMRLARTEFAGIVSEGLRPGRWRYLTVDELRQLKRRYGVPAKVRAQQPTVPAKPKRPSTRRPSARDRRGGRAGSSRR